MNGLQRLKSINGSRMPVSSLGSGSRRRQAASHDTDDARDAKRPRRASDEANSKWLGEPSYPHEDYHDLANRDAYGNGKDTIDLGSNSSTGRTITAAVSAGQSEFRKANSRNSLKPTRQRRKRSVPTKREASVSEGGSSPRRGNDQYLPISPSLNSWDDSKDPPPTDIQTDLGLARKRQRRANSTEPAQPPIKRPKAANRPPIEGIESEDELALAGPLQDRHNIRRGNLTTHQSQTRRGDISSTTFQKAPKQTQQSRLPPPDRSSPTTVVVDQAVAGKHNFWSKDNPVHLCLGPSGATIRLSSGLVSHEMPWLVIVRDKVSKVEFSAGEFIRLHRSSTFDMPSPLNLRLRSALDAEKVVEWLRGKSDRKFLAETTTAQLEKIFKKAFKDASQHKRSSENERTLKRGQSLPLDSSNLHDPFRPSPNTRKTEKMKDQMRGSPTTRTAALVYEGEASEPTPRSQGMETRRTRRSSPDLVPVIRDPSPDRWTKLNPHWASSWQRSVVFPPTGKNRAIVDKDDIPRLDEGEFLNDNLISFYFRHLQAELEVTRPEILEKVYFFSTFFFEKLRSNRGKINYDGVKAWTAKVDLLSYKYIVVPVNENAHWYLAIIYNAPGMLPEAEDENPAVIEETTDVDGIDSGSSSRMATVEHDMSFISLNDDTDQEAPSRSDTSKDVARSSPTPVPAKESQETLAKGRGKRNFGGQQKLDPNLPRIITLDSLGAAHSPTSRSLRDYLIQEAQHRKGVDLSIIPAGMTAKNIPQQNNYCDCGVFVLGYMEEFLKDPDEAVRKILQREDLGWDIRPSHIRNQVRTLLFELQKEEQKRFQAEQDEKLKRQVRRKARREAGEAASSPQARQKSPGDKLNTAPSPHSREGDGQAADRITPSVEKDEGPVSISKASPKASFEEEVKATPKASRANSDEPRFVRCVEKDSSGVSRFFTRETLQQASSTSPKQSAPVVSQGRTDLARQKESNSPHSRISMEPSIEFVRELSATPERDIASQSKGKQRSASPEITMAKRCRHKQSPAAITSPRRYIPPRDMLPSSETDQPSTGPQYDGVDRTRAVDLTSY